MFKMGRCKSFTFQHRVPISKENESYSSPYISQIYIFVALIKKFWVLGRINEIAGEDLTSPGFWHGNQQYV